MTEYATDAIEWLELPPRDYAYSCVSLQYGAGRIAGEYCRLRHIPTELNGHWQHGWHLKQLAVDPRMVANETVKEPGVEQCWVARKDEEDYLKDQGYLARAIGLPIAYVPNRNYQRRRNSLLVMPAHSLDFTTHKWRFSEYIEEIAQIRSDFDTVTACIHPACARKGYWIHDFQRIGIPIILGAEGGDRLSLVRIKALMSQFEFVTGNAYGSYIAYACAFGAKLSIYGPYCEYKAEDYANTGFYRENPGLLDKIIPMLSEDSIRAFLPEFFHHPAEAISRTNWGLDQIGFFNRLSPEEMKVAFEWSDWHHYTKETLGKFTSLARRAVPKTIRIQIKRAIGR
jgi:hypothetical protein